MYIHSTHIMYTLCIHTLFTDKKYTHSTEPKFIHYHYIRTLYMVVIVLSFEQGHSIGLPDRVFSFNNIQIFADGKMSSDFEDEFNPSLSLNLSDALILKAGSTITV